MNLGIIGYIQERPEPALAGPNITAAARNVRPPLKVYPQNAPEDIRQSDTPSRWAHYPIATFQNIAGILSVMSDEFGHRLTAPQHIARTTEWEGGDSDKTLRFRKGINIEKRPSVPYGSLFQLSAEDKYAYLMGK